MASSNRHWPSLFKSKPHSHHHQWQHDISPNPLLPTGYHRAAPFSSSAQGGAGGEEKSPEPKPRWNPKPEQIRILEAIFNSGMVNPPRDEIRKIRAQLQEYGQVGDANVFYWFQNRKSRSKNKQRHLHNHHSPATTSVAPTSVPSPTSSSSSEKSSSTKSCLNSIVAASSNSTTTTAYSGSNNVGPTYSYNFATHGEFFSPDPPFLFQEGGPPQYTQGFCFSELSNVVSAPAVSGPSTNLLLSELLSHGYNSGSCKKEVAVNQAAKMKMDTQLMMSTYSTVSSAEPYHSSTAPLPSTINLVQGAGEPGAMGDRSTMMVFINDVAFEVTVGPFNVRETLGNDVVLINSNGQPVLTNEWGVTLVSLQPGAFYYAI